MNIVCGLLLFEGYGLLTCFAFFLEEEAERERETERVEEKKKGRRRWQSYELSKTRGAQVQPSLAIKVKETKKVRIRILD